MMSLLQCLPAIQTRRVLYGITRCVCSSYLRFPNILGASFVVSRSTPASRTATFRCQQSSSLTSRMSCGATSTISRTSVTYSGSRTSLWRTSLRPYRQFLPCGRRRWLDSQ
eukprot:Rmarinus@m.16892